MLALHGGSAPLEHLLGEWELAPSIVLPLAASAALYTLGVRRLWVHGVGRGVRRWEAGCFAAGWLVLALSLVSPIHALSEQLFSAHMVQHELIMVVATPLMVLGRPLVPMLWAFSPRARQALGDASRSSAWRAAWALIAAPASAWLIHAVVLWGWHLPVFFQATLTSEWVHALQHTSFVAASLLFWWSLLRGARSHRSQGAAVLYLFTTLVHTGALGALLTFSPHAWYPAYASRTAAWGLTVLEDQQLAGLIMWVPASVTYMVAGLALFASWMRASELRVAAYQAAASLGVASGGPR
jgi:putative membrane protein